MYKDWRNTPIEVGSRIIYAVAQQSSVKIREAEVVEIKPILLPSGEYQQRFPFSLKVKPIAEPTVLKEYPHLWHIDDSAARKLTSVDRVTVISSPE